MAVFFIYIDDIVIFFRTLCQHIYDTRIILSFFEESGLSLKLKYRAPFQNQI